MERPKNENEIFMYLERCWVCNADEAEKYRNFQEYNSKGVVLNTSKESMY